MVILIISCVFLVIHGFQFSHVPLQVGAPPEVVARLEEACASAATMAGGDAAAGSSCIGEDPALDQFMEAYCEMLTKYEQELSKPLKEAMLFLQRIECQFKNLTISSSDFGDDPLPLSIFYLLKYSAYLKSIQEKAIIFWVYWFCSRIRI